MLVVCQRFDSDTTCRIGTNIYLRELLTECHLHRLAKLTLHLCLLMVANDFLDNEAQEFFREFRVELCVDG